jgi:hypothetical protein
MIKAIKLGAVMLTTACALVGASSATAAPCEARAKAVFARGAQASACTGLPTRVTTKAKPLTTVKPARAVTSPVLPKSTETVHTLISQPIEPDAAEQFVTVSEVL